MNCDYKFHNPEKIIDHRVINQQSN